MAAGPAAAAGDEDAAPPPGEAEAGPLSLLGPEVISRKGHSVISSWRHLGGRYEMYGWHAYGTIWDSVGKTQKAGSVLRRCERTTSSTHRP